MVNSIALFSCFLLLSIASFGQGKPNDRDYKKAEKYLYLEDYSNALPYFVDLIDRYPDNGHVLYGYAVCTIEMEGSADKGVAISYLQQASEGEEMEELPRKLWFYLGLAYRYNYKFEEAIQAFSKFKSQFTSENPEYYVAEELIRACTNGKVLMDKPVECVIQNLDVVNSEYDEFSPVVSADESKLMFTSTKHPEGSDQWDKKKEYYEYVYETTMQGYNWLPPLHVDLKTDANVGTCFLSPDGQELLLYVGQPGSHDSRKGDIYKSILQGSTWSEPVPLGNHINSRDWEGSASFTPDGQTIFFSSEKPSGYGGSDIYMVRKKQNGSWGGVENLGGVVNSSFNEDAPFIHPDGKTLYFQSNNLNSMGGYDIFKTEFINGRWTTPVNIGHPINSPYDEYSFTITADAQKAYYSSNRPSGFGGQDVYKILIPNLNVNIPLTMIKGRVLDGLSYSAIPTEITVIDKKTNSPLNKVFNPNSETGDYLIILPPGRNYDMIVSAEGYKNHNINIYVPNQSYFYELYQEILLNPVLDNSQQQVGERITVRNAFYDTKSEELSEAGEVKAEMVEKNRSELLEMVNTLASQDDDPEKEKEMDKALSKIYFSTEQDKLDESQYRKDNETSEETQREYIYNEMKEEMRVLASGDTIYTLPTLLTSTKTESIAKGKEKELKKFDLSKEEDKIALPEVKTNDAEILYFTAKDKVLSPESQKKLDEVLKLMEKNDNLGVLLEGHTTSEGDGFINMKLAQERAIRATSYLVNKGIDISRIRVKAYGEMRPVDDKDRDNPTNKRVEITMYKIK